MMNEYNRRREELDRAITSLLTFSDSYGWWLQTEGSRDFHAWVGAARDVSRAAQSLAEIKAQRKYLRWFCRLSARTTG